MKEKGPRLISVLLFLSMDLRRLGRSADWGSNERLRRVNCCSLPRFLGTGSPGSMTVGAVVMMAGAATHTSVTIPVQGHGRCTSSVHGRHGRRLFSDTCVLLRLHREGRVGGMSKAHQTKAARIGGVLLDGWGRRAVIMVARGWARDVAGGRAVAILGHSKAVGRKLLYRLDLVAALEEAGRIEGAAALQVSLATVWSEGPQRHCAGGDRQLIYAGTGRTTRYMAQLEVEDEWRVGVGTMGSEVPRKAEGPGSGSVGWRLGMRAWERLGGSERGRGQRATMPAAKEHSGGERVLAETEADDGCQCGLGAHW